jgi:hypothetical protein
MIEHGKVPEMTRAHRNYTAVEMAVSVVINGTLSLVFAWLIFGGRPAVGLWGLPGLALDFIPQSLMVALMSTIVPTLLTRARLRRGKLVGCAPGHSRLPQNLFVRALAITFASMVAGSAVAVLLLKLLASQPLPITAVYAIKVAYGGMLGAVVTGIALRRALSDLPGARVIPN